MSRYQHTESEVRLMRAMAHMPFGALVSVRLYTKVGSTTGHRPAPVKLDDVANYLEALAQVLSEHVERHKVEEAELTQLRGDVAGMRRLFGLKCEE